MGIQRVERLRTGFRLLRSWSQLRPPTLARGILGPPTRSYAPEMKSPPTSVLADCIAPRSNRNLTVRGKSARHRPETPISAAPSHQPMLTNYSLHFRVISILMYYLRYRASL